MLDSEGEAIRKVEDKFRKKRRFVKRHHWSVEVKREALNRLRRGERGQDVADSLGVPVRTVFGWNHRHTLSFGRHHKETKKQVYTKRAVLASPNGTRDKYRAIIRTAIDQLMELWMEGASRA